MIPFSIVAIFMILTASAFGLYVYSDMMYHSDLIEECKIHGYDGIRFEQINFIRSEATCANFTAEEKIKMKVRQER